MMQGIEQDVIKELMLYKKLASNYAVALCGLLN